MCVIHITGRSKSWQDLGLTRDVYVCVYIDSTHSKNKTEKTKEEEEEEEEEDDGGDDDGKKEKKLDTAACLNRSGLHSTCNVCVHS